MAKKDGGYSHNGIGGRLDTSKYTVVWGKASELDGMPDDGRTALNFVFLYRLEEKKELTEAEWKKRWEESTDTLIVTTKYKSYGGLPGAPPRQYSRKLTLKEFKRKYKHLDATGSGKPKDPCRYGKAPNGSCRKQPNLPLKQRVALAKKALEVSDKCQWVGFDPAYNKIYNAIRRMAPEGMVLFVRADCS